MKKGKQRILPLFLAALLLCPATLPAAAAESASAASMQLMKAQGNVDVTSNSGRNLTKRNNMHLYSGYHVATGKNSYAWISLDDAKLAKLDAVSEMEVRKSGKKLEILLSSGDIFFNVTEPLAEDETLNVRTSTMVVGIRGTSGWIKIVNRWRSEIYVLEGTVQCSVTDPVTAQVKTAEVQSGEMAVALAYPQDQEGDKCDILQERFEVRDIDGFVLTELAQDPGLCADILKASGLDVKDAVEAVHERLEQDQQEMQEKLDGIDGQLAEQDSDVSAGTVWDQESSEAAAPEPPSTPSSDSGGGGSSGSSGPTESVGPVVPLTMPQSAATIQGYLSRSGVEQVILQPSGTGSDTFSVDSSILVNSGQTLTLSGNISTVVESGLTLTVAGTMTSGGELHIMSGAAVIVSSSDTLDVSRIWNEGTLINERTGKIVAANGIDTSGMFGSAGEIQGAVSQTGGKAELTGGTISGGYSFNCDSSDASLKIEGGTISAANSGGALRVANTAGRIDVTGGTIDGGSGPAIYVGSGFREFYIGEQGVQSDVVLRRSELGPVIQLNDSNAGIVYYLATNNGTPVTITSSSILTTARSGSGYILTGAQDSYEIPALLRNARAGETITPLGDCAITGTSVTIGGGAEGDPVILDLNGHTLTVRDIISVEGALEIRGGSIVCESGMNFKLQDGGALTIEDVNIQGGAATSPISGSIVFLAGGGSGSAFTMNGGEIAAWMDDSTGGAIIYVDDNTVVTLNDGTITNKGGGFAIVLNDEAAMDGVRFGGGVVRAKDAEHIIGKVIVDSGLPENALPLNGWDTDRYPDENGYYYLNRTM